MITLKELQQHFVDNLDNKSNFFASFIEGKNLPPKKHLEIYQHSIIGNLQRTLQEIYPVCFKLIGKDFFIYLANEYITNHHSYTFDLSSYGQNFGNFIKSFPNLQNLPYLSDVMNLEWAWHTIFSAKNFPGIDWNKFESLYQEHSETLVFIMPPKSSLLKSLYPIHLIWESNQDTYQGDSKIILSANTIFYYLVWRNGMQRQIDILSFPEWYLLSLIQQEFSLPKIYETIAKEYHHIDVEFTLTECVNRGYLVDFKVL